LSSPMHRRAAAFLVAFGLCLTGARELSSVNSNADFSGLAGRLITPAVAAAEPAVVTADAVTPNAGSGAAQTFALQYSDSAGATDLVTVWTWFTSAFTGSAARSCLIYYDLATNRLHVIDDTGTGWLSATVGSSGTLGNSQCTVALGASTTVTLSGTALRLDVALTFTSGYDGAKSVYLFAAAASGASSGWQARGTWTVPGATVAVTADFVSPNAGSGTAQTFTLQYSDTAGATDLATVWTWFTPTFAPSDASSCLIYYDLGMNQLHLLDDAGGQWLSAAV